MAMEIEKKYVTRHFRQGRSNKLSDMQINELVDKWNAGYTQKMLADEYSISLSTVKRYLKERTLTNKEVNGDE